MNRPGIHLRNSLHASLLLFLAITAEAVAPPRPGTGLSLRAETRRAFETYVAGTEAKNTHDLQGGKFLWIDDAGEADKNEAYAKLKRGEVLMQRISGPDRNSDIPGGMVHDWEGLIFIPGAKLDDVLQLLQDYDHQATYFAPDVERSRIEEHNGDHYRVFLRFRRKNIITVVLDTEHEITYFRDSATRAHSRSSAIRIAEVDNPGETSEKDKTPCQDNGFLWRMETWWRMEEKDGGVYIQNQAVSLTRDIPIGLGWAVEPFITSIPKESLAFTLGAIRKEALRRTKAISGRLSP